MKQMWFLLVFLLGLVYPSLAQDFQQIDKGLYVMWFERYENKIVVAEFEKFMMVIESPKNDSVAQAILEKIAKQFPKKPIRYVGHTHHHAHSIAGFDPYLKNNATLITSNYNYPFIRTKTQDSIGLDKKWIRLVADTSIKDKYNELQIFLISQSKYKVPTNEYMLFYFPQQKTIVSGCLYNKPLDYHEVINSRKTSLLQFITDRKIEFSRIIPTNTCKKAGFEDICTSTMFQETFEKGLKPEEIADQLQKIPVEKLEAGIDSLAIAWKGKTTRSYDWLVCAHALNSIRKDSHRAIILFKTALKMFPNDFWSYYYIGEIYYQKKYLLESLIYYEKARQIANTPDSQAELDEIIAKIKVEVR